MARLWFMLVYNLKKQSLMKPLQLFALALLGLMYGSAQAQVSVNVNLGVQPDWGPSGYSEVNYYYLPDVYSYYDVHASQFIFFQNGNWVRARQLPGRYRNYDLYNGYKVVLNDYRGNSPYAHYHQHKVKYHKGYKGGPQKSIGVRKNNPVKHAYKQKGHGGNGKKGKGNQGHGNQGHGNKKNH